MDEHGGSVSRCFSNCTGIRTASVLGTNLSHLCYKSEVRNSAAEVSCKGSARAVSAAVALHQPEGYRNGTGLLYQAASCPSPPWSCPWLQKQISGKGIITGNVIPSSNPPVSDCLWLGEILQLLGSLGAGWPSVNFSPVTTQGHLEEAGQPLPSKASVPEIISTKHCTKHWLICLVWAWQPQLMPLSIYLFIFVIGWSTEQPVLSQFHKPHHVSTHLFSRTRSPDLLIFGLPCIPSLNFSPSAHGKLWWWMRQGHFHIRIISWQHYCCRRKCQPWPNIPSEAIARVFIRDGIFSITMVGSRQSFNWKNNSGAV